MELLRSLIFVPGNRPNMLERAKTFNADIIMVDLEDSVPPGEEKLNARNLARQWVPVLRQQGKRVMVRLNSLDTGLTRDELAAVIGPDLYGVSVGKMDSPWDVQAFDKLAAPLEAAAGLPSGHVKLIPWIENARAALCAREMALASPRVVAIAFGAEDFTDDMGIERTDLGAEVAVPRALTAIAARAARVAALDSPFVAFRDPDALRQDAQTARRLGYTGKFAIHPSQIDIINETFSPELEAVAYARRVMAAWEEAQANGRGSLSIDGKMVDVPVVKRAQHLLELADAIAQQTGQKA